MFQTNGSLQCILILLCLVSFLKKKSQFKLWCALLLPPIFVYKFYIQFYNLQTCFRLAKPPDYILMENVKGFESSGTRYTVHHRIYCWLFSSQVITCYKQIQSNPVNTDTEGAMESIRIKPVEFNSLSPNIQTGLYTFPLRIIWENLIKDQGIFSLVIILLTLITLSLANLWISLGENWCWSLLGLRGLKKI